MNILRKEIEHLLHHEFRGILGKIESRKDVDLFVEKLSHRLWEMIAYSDNGLQSRDRELLHSIKRRHSFEVEVVKQLSEIKEQMAKNAKQIEHNLNDGRHCLLQNHEPDIANLGFIIKGGETAEASLKGRLMADKILAQWLLDAKEIIAIDPYLFKRSQSTGKNREAPEDALTADEAYASELLAVLGKNKTVRFVYSTQAGVDGRGTVKVSLGVANRINNQISELGLKAYFYAVDNLHDRVWLKLDKNGKWTARVVGTSRDGIGKRPTYIIEMDDEDCAEYRSYVDYLLAVSIVSQGELINVKRSRPRNL